MPRVAAVEVEVRTVPDETGALRADGLGSGGLLPELLEHAAAVSRTPINITLLGRIDSLPSLSVWLPFSMAHLYDLARGMPVTEAGRDYLLVEFGSEVGYATTCDQPQSFHPWPRRKLMDTRR